MVADARADRFAYALVSAAPLQDTDAAGIGVLLKAHDRSTVRTICQALPDTEPLAAAYEALMRVLEEALRTGSRRITVYLDPPEVVTQLTGDGDVPRWLLVKHLKTRGMINQLGSVALKAATNSRFSAKLLAQSARLPATEAGQGEEVPDRPRPPVRKAEQAQLALLTAEAFA